MTAPPRARIRLSDPAQLIAAVPYLLGFAPRDSLVVVTLDERRIGLTLRADLVAVCHAEQLAHQLVGPIRRQHPTAVMLLVFGGEPDAHTGALPHRTLVDTVDDALAEHAIPVVHAAWSAGALPGVAWSCYDEPGCAGTVPDPAGSELAAATVAAGTVTFASRDELAGLLTPDPRDALVRRERLLARADAEHPMSRQVAAARYAHLADLRTAAQAGAGTPEDGALVRAVSGLCDHRVRDACLAWSHGDSAPAAEQLWLALTRAAPGPYRAEPATLLAVSAYLRGDGALAALALDAALEADPAHALAELLGRALAGGLHPADIRTLATDSGVDAWLELFPAERDGQR